MTYNPDKHHRRSIRLPTYDYSQPGAYFVTLCTKDRRRLFGKIKAGIICLNQYGWIAAEEWYRTAEVRPNVQLDAFIVMPDHLHGILMITEGKGSPPVSPHDPPVCPHDPPVCPHDPPVCPDNGKRSFGGARPGTLSTIMRQYKSIVTKRINRRWNVQGQSVWQRNYYERIIRSEAELHRTRRYILDNPLQWSRDQHHPGSPRRSS